MEPATSLIIGVAVFLICITAFGIYTAFGPPSKELQDPYEMHED
jgi:PsbN protein